SEEDIVTSVNAVVLQIAETERKLRNGLLKKDGIKFQDTVYRALAVFSNARIMTSEECLKLISEIRLGVSLGLLKDISVQTLNELMLATRPATMQKSAGRPLDASERDIQRAELIRNKLGRRG
ncbi:MAG TPA: ATP--guanido phosphotransferase, partial [Clostridiales bacterium]|nr:ATP--guanido phosphotransferase [Clostridiales bacterium]